MSWRPVKSSLNPSFVFNGSIRYHCYCNMSYAAFTLKAGYRRLSPALTSFIGKFLCETFASFKDFNPFTTLLSSVLSFYVRISAVFVSSDKIIFQYRLMPALWFIRYIIIPYLNSCNSALDSFVCWWRHAILENGWHIFYFLAFGVARLVYLPVSRFLK